MGGNSAVTTYVPFTALSLLICEVGSSEVAYL